MSEKHDLKETVEMVSDDALDEAMRIAFGPTAATDERRKGESSTVIGRYKLLEQIGDERGEPCSLG